MKTKNLLFAMLLLGSATVVNAQENLLSNPGFEGETIVINEPNGIIHPKGWFDPWDFYDEGLTHFNTIVDDAHSGNAALYMYYSPEGYPSGGDQIQCIDASVTGLDKVYTLSFWYKVVKASNYKGRPIRWKYCIGMWHSATDVPANAVNVADQGIDSQGIAIDGETNEGDWKFATVDYDFGNGLTKYAPTEFYPHDKDEMKNLAIGVTVSNGDLLLDDFSLTVKGGTSGIETTTANQPLPVKVDGGELYVGGVKGSRITVYDTIGRTVANTVATSETTHISNLPKNQLLVVKAGNKTAKVMMR